MQQWAVGAGRFLAAVSARGVVDEDQIEDLVHEACGSLDLAGRRVLVIIPDGTRTAPVGQIFKAIYRSLGRSVRKLDVMVALGTHPPMAESAICARLEITEEERASEYAGVDLLNHNWHEQDGLVRIGELSSLDVKQLSGGRFEMDVPVTINRAILEYDQLLIVGPVFPHEVAGFSGGAKYLFPGISGPELLHFFHWLGALTTNFETIGVMETPVRHVIHRAAALVPTRCHAFSIAVSEKSCAALFFGDCEQSWSAAATVSQSLHVVYKDRSFETVLSCAPTMYTDLWVGGKCMYKLEPVVATGGELIIYAPHIRQISPTHGRDIERIGYHVAAMFEKQWDRFRSEPWSVLAHSTHVRGRGAFVYGQEFPLFNVTLATGIPEETCRRINLGYRDPRSIDPNQFANREHEGMLLVREAGEILYRRRPRSDAL